MHDTPIRRVGLNAAYEDVTFGRVLLTAPYRDCSDLRRGFINYSHLFGDTRLNMYAGRFREGSWVVAPTAGILTHKLQGPDDSEFSMDLVSSIEITLFDFDLSELTGSSWLASVVIKLCRAAFHRSFGGTGKIGK